MTRNLIFILSIFFSYQSVLADDAPICFTHGGNVKPIENKDIQMYSETIDITLFPTYYEVEVNYVFKNKGNEQKVILGFPSSSNFDMDFKAFDGDAELEITKRNSDWEFKPKNGLSCQYLSNPIDQFECHTVFFKKGETKYIKNAYQHSYDPTFHNEQKSSFYYIVTTGAFWKDKITSIELRVNTENAPRDFDLENAFINQSKTSIKNYYKKIENVEPTEDFYFGIKYTSKLTAYNRTSTLFSSGNINYGIENLEDQDVRTAWIEGENDSGIGSVVKFKNFNKSSNLINGIEIINGYAKSYNSFIENNRVSIIKVTVINKFYHEEYEVIQDFYNGKYKTKEEYIFALNDTPYIQYLEFDSPIQATEVIFEIIEVYKGTKYDDTAISEIHFCENGIRYQGKTSNIPMHMFKQKK